MFTRFVSLRVVLRAQDDLLADGEVGSGQPPHLPPMHRVLFGVAQQADHVLCGSNDFNDAFVELRSRVYVSALSITVQM